MIAIILFSFFNVKRSARETCTELIMLSSDFPLCCFTLHSCCPTIPLVIQAFPPPTLKPLQFFSQGLQLSFFLMTWYVPLTESSSVKVVLHAEPSLSEPLNIHSQQAKPCFEPKYSVKMSIY